jgi:hypothetical protein
LNHLSPEELADVVSSGPDDPRRRHAQSCTRCGALLLSYQSFMEPEPNDAAGLDEARATLGRTVREFEGGRPLGTNTSPRIRWWSPPVRMALAFAAAVVVVAGVMVATRPGMQRGPSGVLRGPGRDSPEPGGLLGVTPARVVAGRGVELAWRRSANAETYVVRLLDPSLNELRRFPAGAETSLVVPLTILPGSLAPGSELLWQAIGLRGGDPVAQSEIGRFRLP